MAVTRLTSVISVAILLTACSQQPDGYNSSTQIVLGEVPGLGALTDGNYFPAYGTVSVDETAPCVTDGWPNHETDSERMKPAFPATVSVSWHPSSVTFDPNAEFVSVISTCYVAARSRPSTPTTGFFAVAPFNFDNSDFLDSDQLTSQWPYVLTCASPRAASVGGSTTTSHRSGYALVDAVVTLDDVIAGRPSFFQGRPRTVETVEDLLERGWACGDQPPGTTCEWMTPATANEQSMIGNDEPLPSNPCLSDAQGH